MRAIVVGLAVAAVLGGSPATAEAPAPAPYGGDAIFPTGLPAAPAEGHGTMCHGYRCVWNAPHQQALILTQYRGGFLMKPITHGRARWLQAAYCDRRNVACD